MDELFIPTFLALLPTGTRPFISGLQDRDMGEYWITGSSVLNALPEFRDADWEKDVDIFIAHGAPKQAWLDYATEMGFQLAERVTDTRYTSGGMYDVVNLSLGPGKYAIQLLFCRRPCDLELCIRGGFDLTICMNRFNWKELVLVNPGSITSGFVFKTYVDEERHRKYEKRGVKFDRGMETFVERRGDTDTVFNIKEQTEMYQALLV